MKKVYIIAAIIALITCIVTYGYLQSLEAMAKKDYVEVVVAAYDIPPQTVISSDMVAIKKISSDSRHPLTAKAKNEIVGMVTQSKIVKDEQIITSKLIKLGENTGGFSFVVPEGMRAFTIAVDSVYGVAGFLRPGDRVDIVVSMILTTEKTEDSEKKENLSFMALQNIEVLAVGNIAKGAKIDGAVEYGTVTLAIKAEDCVKMNMYANDGKVRLLLRSPADKETGKYNVVVPIMMVE